VYLGLRRAFDRAHAEVSSESPIFRSFFPSRLASRQPRYEANFETISRSSAVMKIESTPAEEELVGLKYNYRKGASSDSPLVVLVHGRAGNRGVMWTFERCVPEGWHIVSFEAFLQDPIGGWSWWDMAQEGSRREAIEGAVARLDHALAAFVRLQGLQPRFRVGFGFSQGAVLLSAGALAGRIPFDGVALLAGFIVIPDAVAHPPAVFVAHGTLDETVSIEKARRGVNALKAMGLSVEYVEEPVTHKVGIEGTRALKQWMGRWENP
jgi:predicted esterase